MLRRVGLSVTAIVAILGAAVLPPAQYQDAMPNGRGTARGKIAELWAW